jgi:putative two-component system response regulator
MGKKPTLLIVDDEERNVKLLTAMLSQEDYHIVTAVSGQEALNIVDNMMLDLILLDVMMMGMDGFQVCRKIKKDKKTRGIPVLMVTVLTGKEDRIKAMEAGADDFLSKPVDRRKLIKRVSSLINSCGAGSVEGICGN